MTVADEASRQTKQARRFDFESRAQIDLAGKGAPTCKDVKSSSSHALDLALLELVQTPTLAGERCGMWQPISRPT